MCLCSAMGPERDVMCVLGMLMSYAYKHSYHDVISAISSVVGDLKQLCVPHILIACYTLRQIIERSVFDDYAVAIRLLDVLYFEGGQELVKFGQYWNLSMCIRMKMMFYLMVIDDDDDNDDDNLILAKLNEYFPVDGVPSQKHYILKDKKIIAKQKATILKFRKFFLSLLIDEERQIAYLQEEYVLEFGANFMADLNDMLNTFLQKIENNTGQTDIEKILDGSFKGSDQQQCSMASAAFLVLLKYTHSKQNLSSEDIKHIVSILTSDGMLNITSACTSNAPVATRLHRGKHTDSNQLKHSTMTHQSVQLSNVGGENSSIVGRHSYLVTANSSIMIIDPEPVCDKDVCIPGKSDVAMSGIRGRNTVQTNEDSGNDLLFPISDSNNNNFEIIDVVMSHEQDESSQQVISNSECMKGDNSVMVITDSDSSTESESSSPVLCAADVLQRRILTAAARIVIEETPMIESRQKSVVDRNERVPELMSLSQTHTQDSTISSSTDSQGTLSYSSQQGYFTAQTSQGANEERTSLEDLLSADDRVRVKPSQINTPYEVKGGYESQLQTDCSTISSDDEEMVTAQSEFSSTNRDELRMEQCLSSDEDRSQIMDVPVSPSIDNDSGMDNDLISRCIKSPDTPLCIVKVHRNKVLENKHRLKSVQLFS